MKFLISECFFFQTQDRWVMFMIGWVTDAGARDHVSVRWVNDNICLVLKCCCCCCLRKTLLVSEKKIWEVLMKMFRDLIIQVASFLTHSTDFPVYHICFCYINFWFLCESDYVFDFDNTFKTGFLSMSCCALFIAPQPRISSIVTTLLTE